MTSQEINTRELVRIAMSTMAVHFLTASAVGYTFGVMGILNPETSIIRFTLIFSTVWGLFGAGMVWKRERDAVNLYIIDQLAKQKLGIDTESQKFLSLLDYVYVPFSNMKLPEGHSLR